MPATGRNRLRAAAGLRSLLERRLVAAWFTPPSQPLAWWLRLLLPLSWLTSSIARARRARLLGDREQPPRPVVVIGNLVAGGAGKTPASIALAHALRERGFRPGLLASGYGAPRRDPRLVAASDDARVTGDEPVLLARSTGMPVAAAPARRAALELLRAAHPEVDVIVSDDGLQHAALPRTIEIAVFDARGAGNGRLLPAGPLREPLEHLATMDALLLGPQAVVPIATSLPVFRMTLEAVGFRSLAGSRALLEPARFVRHLRGRSVVALAGIAEPARFFRTLALLGVTARCVALSDHARIDRALIDAQEAAFVVMTEKDAVKLADDADERCFALQVRAALEPALIDWLVERLRGQPIA